MTQQLSITDHAIVRWLERSHGIERAEILTEIFGGTIPVRLPDGQYRYGEFILAVADNCIITIKLVAERKRRAAASGAKRRSAPERA